MSNIAAVYAGDLLINHYWGVAININSGALGDNAAATGAKIPGTSSFTINTRSSTTVANGFDKNLLTVRNNGDTTINGSLTCPGKTITAGKIISQNTVNSFVMKHYPDLTETNKNNITNRSYANLVAYSNGGIQMESPIITSEICDIWNFYNNKVYILCTGMANSGCYNSSRILLDFNLFSNSLI